MISSRGFDKIADEPFRLFFPLGVLFALIGVLYWPLTIYHLALTNLPIDFHVWMQIYGFLWSFIIGFLATALPRLTQTSHFTRSEVSLLFSLSLLIVISLFADLEIGAHIFFALSLSVFITFLFKRFLVRKKSPPSTFIFIPFAFGSALFGSLMMIALHFGWNTHFTEWYSLSRNLLTLGFTSFLILGIGGFLIRSILGWGQVLPANLQERLSELPKNKISELALHGMVGVGFLASFVIEAFFYTKWILFLRALLVSFELLTQIKIYKKPQSKKVTSVFLFMSLWLFLAGFWGTIFFPQNLRLAFVHLCFIGGFSLSVFSIATRVILSHCGFSKLLNRHYLPFTLSGILILVGLLARFSADFLPHSYQEHLAFGALSWVVGVMIWSIFILSKAMNS